MLSVEKSLLDRAFTDIDERAVGADAIMRRVLDAAREQFRLVGIRRSSVEDVARRAGVSRITVYRRFPTKDALVESVLVRELRGHYVEFRTAMRSAPTAAERVVAGFVIGLRAARENPLVGGLMTVEPRSLAPFLTAGGRVLGVIRTFLAEALERERTAGAIPPSVDVTVVAELLTRITLSLFVNPDSAVDLDDPAALEAFARRYLAPFVTGAVGGQSPPGAQAWSAPA